MPDIPACQSISAPPTRPLLSVCRAVQLVQSDRFREVIRGLWLKPGEFSCLCHVRVRFSLKKDRVMTPLDSFLLPLRWEVDSRMRLLLPRGTEPVCGALLLGVTLAAVSASLPGKFSVSVHARGRAPFPSVTYGMFGTSCSTLFPSKKKKWTEELFYF